MFDKLSGKVLPANPQPVKAYRDANYQAHSHKFIASTPKALASLSRFCRYNGSRMLEDELNGMIEDSVIVHNIIRNIHLYTFPEYSKGCPNVSNPIRLVREKRGTTRGKRQVWGCLTF